MEEKAKLVCFINMQPQNVKFKSVHINMKHVSYMHRWCLDGPINSYHSLKWNNLILCLYNVDTLNICMKEFGSEK